jgi:hypothetical protein
MFYDCIMHLNKVIVQNGSADAVFTIKGVSLLLQFQSKQKERVTGLESCFIVPRPVWKTVQESLV